MARAPSHALKRRHAALRRVLAERSLDALVVTALPNILYLSNFTGSSAIVVIDGDGLQFITDSRYRQSLEETRGSPHECPGLEVILTEGSYDATLARTLLAGRAQRVGFEAAHLSVSRYEWLRSTLSTGGRPPAVISSARADAAGHAALVVAPPTLVATEGLIEGLRVRKDAYELDVLREAGRRLSGVAREVIAMPLQGRTEQEVAADIDRRLRHAGFARPAFDTIVASGENGALPHARPTERTIHEGDLVVLDFGGVYTSYCVDITRTVAVGPPTARAREVHRAVLEAQRRAVEAVTPGASRFSVDEAARRALEDSAMGEAFAHGTGHGLGIEVHELPRIVQRRPDVDQRDDVVEVGMVFTIEPGAYFPGWGGVRIEDDVAVTERGAEWLTDVPSDLVVS